MADKLNVTKRELRPRSVRAKLRKEGKVLGVVYGYKVESTPVAFEEMALRKILRDHGDNALIELNIDGKKVNTLVHGTEADPFTNEYKHVEFMAVKMDEATEVEAEVVLVGDAKGVKEGGFLAQTLYKVTVSATPANIPERVELDVSELGIGDGLTVADIPKNKDYEIVSDSELQIAAVNEPVAVEDLETDEATEGAAEATSEESENKE